MVNILRINTGTINRLVFKYQELTINSQNYSEYLSILIGSIFHHNIRVVENPSAFQDK
jgi:hypothetical protein